MTGIETLVDRLLDMGDEEFYDVAREDRRLRKVRDAELPPLLDALRHDDVLDRWLDTVNATDADIVLSITMAKERMDAAEAGGDDAEFHRQRWIRARAVRALEGVREQRREVKELIAERNRGENLRREQEWRERHLRHRESSAEQAFQRALRRLRKAHLEEFEGYLREELALVGAEDGSASSAGARSA